MGIQVANSLHAAGSYRVGEDDVRSQSPNGMLITKFIQEGEGDTVFFQILLDYPLDPGSCALSVIGFEDTDPATEEDASLPFIPFIVHINDKEKLIFLFETTDDESETFDRNFHVALTNYQANLSEQLPVAVVILPDP